MSEISTNEAAFSPATCQRRSVRRQLDARVVLVSWYGKLEGWSLNVSATGLRAFVVDDDRFRLAEMIAHGRVYVAIGDEPARAARIVWDNDRPGGAVLGLAFECA